MTRQAVLAVQVLDDVDLEPAQSGVVLRDGPALHVGWDEIELAVGDALGQHDLDRARAAVRQCFRLRRRLAEVAADPSLATSCVRLLGRPAHDAGPGWSRRSVLGGAVELGLGVVVEPRTPTGVVPVPDLALARAGLERMLRTGSPTWWRLQEHLESMGRLAAQALLREPSRLRPVGDADLVTLLASSEFRHALAAGCATGMRAAMVPSRVHGWLDARRLDAALAAAAFSLTEPADRAFERPLLVTGDEVALVAPGGRIAALDLRDPVPHQR